MSTEAAMDMLGKKIEVLWEGHESNPDSWYPGLLKEYNVETGKHLIEFDDGDIIWDELTKITYRLAKNQPIVKAPPAASPPDDASAAPPAEAEVRRRRIDPLPTCTHVCGGHGEERKSREKGENQEEGGREPVSQHSPRYVAAPSPL